jgi:diguanylate cyclase (GGDEF)-like protein/PAS domain S-box-containing protein
MATGMPDHPSGKTSADPSRSFDDAFHKTIVDNIADGVYYVDRERTITYWNHGAERLTGYQADDMVGQHCYANLLSHVDAAGSELCFAGCPLAETIADGEVREAEVWLRHRAGHRRPVRIRTAPVFGADGSIVGAVEVFDDASRLIEARNEAKLAHRDALTDALTGIPNRRHFDAALAARLEDLRRYGWPFALLIADIDHFKRVNDAHGHDVGDLALVTVAATLTGGIRAGDLAARWGGEEFAVLVQEADSDPLVATAERLRILVARSVIQAAGEILPVRISVGGTPADASDTATSLITRADGALYSAKQGGRDRIAIVDPAGVPIGRSGPTSL